MRPGGISGWLETVKLHYCGKITRQTSIFLWAVLLKQEPAEVTRHEVCVWHNRNPLLSGRGGCQQIDLWTGQPPDSPGPVDPQGSPGPQRPPGQVVVGAIRPAQNHEHLRAIIPEHFRVVERGELFLHVLTRFSNHSWLALQATKRHLHRNNVQVVQQCPL